MMNLHENWNEVISNLIKTAKVSNVDPSKILIKPQHSDYGKASYEFWLEDELIGESVHVDDLPW